MTSLPVQDLDISVDPDFAAATAAMVVAAEGALVKALRAELLDHEIEELLTMVTTELVTTYLATVHSEGANQ